MARAQPLSVWDIDYPDDEPSERHAKFLNRDWPPQGEWERPANWEEPKQPSRNPQRTKKPVKYPAPKPPTEKAWLKASDPKSAGCTQLTGPLVDMNPQNRYQFMVNGYPVYHHFCNPKDRTRRLYPMYFTPDQVNRIVQTPIYNFTNDLGLAYCFLIMDFFDLKSRGFYAYSSPHQQVPAMKHSLFHRQVLFSFNPSWSLFELAPDQRDFYFAAHNTRRNYYHAFERRFKASKGNIDTSGTIHYSPVIRTGQKPDTAWLFSCSNDGIDPDHNFPDHPNTSMLYLIPYMDMVIFIDNHFDLSVGINQYTEMPHHGLQTLHKFLWTLSNNQITFTSHDDANDTDVCDYLVPTQGMRKMLFMRNRRVRYWETRGQHAVAFRNPIANLQYSAQLEPDQPSRPRAARDPRQKIVTFKSDEELVNELEEDPIWYQHIGYWEVIHFNELGEEFKRFRERALYFIMEIWHPFWVELKEFTDTMDEMLKIRAAREAALLKNITNKTLQEELDQASKEATDYRNQQYAKFRCDDAVLENAQIDVEEVCMQEIFDIKGRGRNKVNRPRQHLTDPILTVPAITELLKLVSTQKEEDRLKSGSDDDTLEIRTERHKSYVMKFLELRKRLVSEIWKEMGYSESNWQ